jgi:hypothetical protein
MSICEILIEEVRPTKRAVTKTKIKEKENIFKDLIMAFGSLVTKPRAMASMGDSMGVTSIPPITRITLSISNPRATIIVDNIIKK